MNEFKVLKIFYTSFGEIAILRVPENPVPKVGMRVMREDGSEWKITSTSMMKSSDMSNGFKQFDPPVWLMDCKVDAQNIKSKLKEGDALTPC